LNEVFASFVSIFTVSGVSPSIAAGQLQPRNDPKWGGNKANWDVIQTLRFYRTWAKVGQAQNPSGQHNRRSLKQADYPIFGKQYLKSVQMKRKDETMLLKSALILPRVRTAD
jgi:hypothetical protein